MWNISCPMFRSHLCISHSSTQVVFTLFFFLEMLLRINQLNWAPRPQAFGSTWGTPGHHGRWKTLRKLRGEWLGQWIGIKGELKWIEMNWKRKAPDFWKINGFRWSLSGRNQLNQFNQSIDLDSFFFWGNILGHQHLNGDRSRTSKIMRMVWSCFLPREMDLHSNVHSKKWPFRWKKEEQPSDLSTPLDKPKWWLEVTAITLMFVKTQAGNSDNLELN